MIVLCRLGPEAECASTAVVRIEDQHGGSEPGCREHATRALRAIAGARVYPLPGHDGEAIEVHRAAHNAR